MGKIKVITAADFDKYAKKRQEIVELYNDSGGDYEEPVPRKEDFIKPEYCYVFYFKGMKGGILVEQMISEPRLSVITYAALPEEDRGKGYCMRLIDKADAYMLDMNSLLMAVQLNPNDSHEYWIRQGFKHPKKVFGITESLWRHNFLG